MILWAGVGPRGWALLHKESSSWRATIVIGNSRNELGMCNSHPAGIIFKVLLGCFWTTVEFSLLGKMGCERIN